MDRFPQECPEILSQNELENAVAIVAVHSVDPIIDTYNTGTWLRKVSMPAPAGSAVNTQDGWYLILPRLTNKAHYSFGRHVKWKTDKHPPPDIFLPGSPGTMGNLQFSLTPDPKIDCWRYQSGTETKADVNGVPVRDWNSRTRLYKGEAIFPHVLFLDQSRANHVNIWGLKLTIWLLKSPREVLRGAQNSDLRDLQTAQDVNNRTESWAQERFFVDPLANKVSQKSFRLLERFTGDTATAKMFDNHANGVACRDAEFAKMCKNTTQESIVRYLQMADVNGIPSIITETHQGFCSFADCYGHIQHMHPTLRCTLASSLLRRLMSALDYLHSNRMIHGTVSDQNVLLRADANLELERVLLVDYSNVSVIPAGMEIPRKKMVRDARAVVSLVDQCCGLWDLRKGHSTDWQPEHKIQELIDQTNLEMDQIRQYTAKHYPERGQWKPGKFSREHCMQTLGEQTFALSNLKNQLEQNKYNLSLNVVTAHMIQDVRSRWPNQTGVLPTLLTLGHSYLDELIDKLRRNKFDTTPRDICAQLQVMEGDCKDPWRTFTVSKMFVFTAEHNARTMFDKQAIARYLAYCIQMYPDIADAILSAYNQWVQPAAGLVNQHLVAACSTAIEQQVPLPPNMKSTLTRLATSAGAGKIAVQENTAIWYHAPSRMFNITQLQRLTDSATLRECIENNAVVCTNFAEVRGDPQIEGCFVTLDLLPTVLQALKLDIVDPPRIDSPLPTLDPTDFSGQPHELRLILARKGLVGYASLSRTANQITHYPRCPEEVYCQQDFLPTLFGDMWVLPDLPSRAGFKYKRPRHWSKFIPADPNARRLLLPTKPVAQPESSFDEPVLSILQDLIDEYKEIFRNTCPHRRPLPSSFDSGSSFGSTGPSTPKRRMRNKFELSVNPDECPYPSVLLAPDRGRLGQQNDVDQSMTDADTVVNHTLCSGESVDLDSAMSRMPTEMYVEEDDGSDADGTLREDDDDMADSDSDSDEDVNEASQVDEDEDEEMDGNGETGVTFPFQNAALASNNMPANYANPQPQRAILSQLQNRNAILESRVSMAAATFSRNLHGKSKLDSFHLGDSMGSRHGNKGKARVFDRQIRLSPPKTDEASVADTVTVDWNAVSTKQDIGDSQMTEDGEDVDEDEEL